MLRSQFCASPENQNPKLSKTDYLDIAVYGELLPDGSLHPVVTELLGKAQEMAGQVEVKVSLVVIGTQIARKAREFFRFGTDRIFVYDDPLFKRVDSNMLTAIFEHFFSNYKPSVILFGNTPEGNVAVQAAALCGDITVAYGQTDFNIRSNKDLIFPAGQIQPELLKISDSRPQAVTVPAGFFKPLIPDSFRKGELILCELPESLRN